MSIAVAAVGNRAIADQARASAEVPKARRLTAKPDPVLQPEAR